MSIMKLVRNWIPFAFCMLLVQQYVTQGPASSQNLQYFSIWLPMCFFFVCAVTHSAQQEIKALRNELEELRQSRRD